MTFVGAKHSCQQFGIGTETLTQECFARVLTKSKWN